MIVGITGHVNIERIFNKYAKNNGQEYDNESYEKLIIEITESLNKICKNFNKDFNDLTLVSGMARGIDEIFAEIAYRNNLKLILSIPQSVEWHKNRGLSRNIRSQAIEYDKYLNYKNTIKINEIKKNYGGEKFLYANFARNKNIIDESEIVLSYKAYESSGTNDAIKSAIKHNKYLGNVKDILNTNFNFNNFKYINKEEIKQKKKEKAEELKNKISFQYNLKDIVENLNDTIEYNKVMIIQGCNAKGVMGAGIAEYLKNKFPNQYQEYQQTFKEEGLNLGDVIFNSEKNNLFFGNIITQENYGKGKQFVDYRAVYKGLTEVKNFCIKNKINLIKTPLIGTGLAGGSWAVIEYFYKEIFKDTEIIIEFYEINKIHLEKCFEELNEREKIRKNFSKKDFPKNFNFDNLKFLNNNELNIKINYHKNLNKIDLSEYKINIVSQGKMIKENNNTVYIGRPSLWQNPFPVKKSKFSDKIYTLEESLSKYQNETLIKKKVKIFVEELIKNKTLTLSCFCIDKTINGEYQFDNNYKCHGEILAKKIFSELRLELSKEKIVNNEISLNSI